LSTVHVVRAERHGEIGIDAVHPPGFAALLIDAHQQRIPFLTRIKVIGRIADDGHAPPVIFQHLGELIDTLGDEILMLHRHHRVCHAVHRGDLVDPVAAGIDELFARDIAVFRVDQPFAIGLPLDRLHRVEALDLGTGAARAPCEGLGQLAGVDIAIQRIPKRTRQAFHRDERVALATLGSIDDLIVDTHRFRHAGEVMVAVEMALVMGKPDAAGDVVVDGKVGISGQFLIETDRVAFQANHHLDRPELRHLRC